MRRHRITRGLQGSAGAGASRFIGNEEIFEANRMGSIPLTHKPSPNRRQRDVDALGLGDGLLRFAAARRGAGWKSGTIETTEVANLSRT